MISQNPKRILIADDDVELRTMLGLMLSEEGYHVGHATTGAEAVEMHRRNPFDLVILELVLKDMDGFQTLTELRHQPSPAKFIAISKPGWMSAQISLHMAEKLGAHGVLAKPFQPEALLAVVRKILSEKPV